MSNLQKYFTGFLVIIFFGLGAYYLVHFGYYPVAVVGAKIITANRLDVEYAVAHNYYVRALSGSDETDPESREFKRELRRAVMENLIEQSLIQQDLAQRLGKDLASVIDGKLLGIQQKDPKILEETARLLYGIDLSDFTSLVLVPQAHKEILQGRLFLEKVKYEEWLRNAKKDAKIFIITPEFYWQDDAVRLRD